MQLDCSFVISDRRLLWCIERPQNVMDFVSLNLSQPAAISLAGNPLVRSRARGLRLFVKVVSSPIAQAHVGAPAIQWVAVDVVNELAGLCIHNQPVKQDDAEASHSSAQVTGLFACVPIPAKQVQVLLI